MTLPVRGFVLPIPSSRLTAWMGCLASASLAMIAFPDLWLPFVAFNVVTVLGATLDWAVTPGPSHFEVSRLTPERFVVQGRQTVTLLVRNRSRVAVRVRIRDCLPKGFRGEVEEQVADLPGLAETRLETQVTPTARGAFAWGDMAVRYRSLLGLWERALTVPAQLVVKVYPNLSDLHSFLILARKNRLDVLGIRPERLRGGAWEFESLREYGFGDDVRLIDWKATARRGKAIVRDLQRERNQTVILLVDSGRLMNAEVAGVAKLDHAINTALVLAHVALSRGDQVGLCSFSHTLHAWVTPRAHLGQLRLLSETLYNLHGDYTESDHGRCLRQLAARHAKRALLIVLTDFVDAETAREMIAHVALAARRHLVLFVALNEPLLARAAQATATTTREGFRKITAIELLHERREVLARLRQLGAIVLDVEAGVVTAPLIASYLEITGRGLL